MHSFTLPKNCLITKSWEYETVYRRGKRIRGKNCSLICLPVNNANSRLGISIHGVKKAVQRNRIKRIIREFYRLNRAALPASMDMVFTVRGGFSPNSPDEVKHVFYALLKKIGSPSPTP